MNIEEIRSIAQTIFIYYFAIGLILTAITSPISAVMQLAKQEKHDRKRTLCSILKGVGFVVGYAAIGCISELILPGSSFVFIVIAGVPTVFLVAALVICSLIMPLIAIHIIASCMLIGISMLVYWLASLCQNKKQLASADGNKHPLL